VLTFGINPSLDGVTALCEALGNPQATFSSIQITGTNGKSSTARITAAILQSHGRATGLYTSPELERYPERTGLGCMVLDDARFARAVGAAIDTAKALWGEVEPGVPAVITEFELLTAAALWAFSDGAVDTAVLEVGMGGRWDATSVVIPEVAVITGVGLDHMHILGDTLEKIAAEKAAIIRPGSVPVLGPGTEGLENIFLERCLLVGGQARAVRAHGEPTPVDDEFLIRYRLVERPSRPGGSTVVDVEGVHGAYPGLRLTAPAYQAANIATAVAAAEAALGTALDVATTQHALETVTFPGRFESMDCRVPVIVDGSHNPQASAVLAGAIADAWSDQASRPMVLLGVLDDKDAEGIVEALCAATSVFAVVSPRSPRALAVDDLAEVVARVTGSAPRTFDSVAAALDHLLVSPDAAHGLVVTGSLTVAGEARSLLRDTSATTQSGATP
jgi:dihydrofolate synthase/folylpolyglutamate synthase